MVNFVLFHILRRALRNFIKTSTDKGKIREKTLPPKIQKIIISQTHDSPAGAKPTEES